MKTITKISTQKKAGRYSVELDKKFAFGVAESVLVKYGLAKGRELSDALIEQIKYDDAIAKALNVALTYLGHALRTKHQIRQKLRDKNVEEEIQNEVLNHLESLGYVNDQNYAEHYVATKKAITPKGPNVIRMSLKQAGVVDDVIDQAMIAYSTEEQLEIAENLASKLAQSYQRESTRQKKQKTIQSLANKGFSFDISQQAVDNVIVDNNPDDERQNIKRQCDKMWHRYRTVAAKERLYKVKRQLYAKGFTSDLIEEVLIDQMQ